MQDEKTALQAKEIDVGIDLPKSVYVKNITDKVIKCASIGIDARKTADIFGISHETVYKIWDNQNVTYIKQPKSVDVEGLKKEVLEFCKNYGNDSDVYTASIPNAIVDYLQEQGRLTQKQENVSKDNLSNVGDGWQDIETAPKDGTRILANVKYGITEKLLIIWWDGKYGYWIWSINQSYEISPTHWMPLPQPPKKEGE